MKCRICFSTELEPFLDLGMQPHCNRFLTSEQINDPTFVEAKYPLETFFCHNCSLVQLGHTVPPELMFVDFLYVSGTTQTLKDHFFTLAGELVERFDVGPSDLVVDIGSNDGTFLKGFQKQGTRVLGIDPATEIVKMANDAGVETIEGFFSEELAKDVAKTHGKAKLITGAGVFFHVKDLLDFVAGVKALLADDGVFAVQAIYLADMVNANSFDNIYHEHMCYYTLAPMKELFRQVGMKIFDVERSDIHGGSLLVYAQSESSPRDADTDRLAVMTASEESEGFYEIDIYKRFASRAQENRDKLVEIVDSLTSNGERLYAFGAPAKGNTLLNYCGFNTDQFEVATEKSDLKIGLFTPGSHIPVVDEADKQDDAPDTYLLLPWNFKTELLKKESKFREAGGKFIVPIPDPQVI
jgi:SAM-dependent methyltransferase